MADSREHHQGGQPKPGQLPGHQGQEHEEHEEREEQEHQGLPEPGQRHRPGRMSDTDRQRGQRGDEESGQPVQLDAPDRQSAEQRRRDEQK